MKIALSLICCVLVTPHAQGQNLVPNGSFEQYTTCPQFISSVYLTGWENLHTSSADYFNACNQNGVADVPFNEFGYQEAADGQAYVGMATTALGGGPWYREIVGIELSQALQPGVPVCLSFQTALGGFGRVPWNSTAYSSKGLGLMFFTTFPADWSTYLYPNTAALHLDYVPMDTALWYSVTGVYVPDSAYTYIAVGNFFADSLSEHTLIDSTGYGQFGVAYAFVDDVRVSFDLNYCTLAGPQVLDKNPIEAFPVPCGDILNIERPSSFQGLVSYVILDACGRAVRDGGLEVSSTATVPLSGLDAGFYRICLIADGGGRAEVAIIHTNQ